MNIREYLDMTGLSPAQFSSLTGVCQQSIYLYLNGKITPRVWTAKKIEKETKGKVTVKDLIPDYEAP